MFIAGTDDIGKHRKWSSDQIYSSDQLIRTSVCIYLIDLQGGYIESTGIFTSGKCESAGYFSKVISVFLALFFDFRYWWDVRRWGYGSSENRLIYRSQRYLPVVLLRPDHHIYRIR